MKTVSLLALAALATLTLNSCQQCDCNSIYRYDPARDIKTNHSQYFH